MTQTNPFHPCTRAGVCHGVYHALRDPADPAGDSASLVLATMNLFERTEHDSARWLDSAVHPHSYLARGAVIAGWNYETMGAVTWRKLRSLP